MLKVVIDTNVLVSSLWGGKPKQTIDLWKKGKIKLAISLSILEEYLRVLYEFGVSEEDLKEKAFLFYDPDKVETVIPSKNFSVINEDPDDNKFLEVAVESKSNFIVTGDRHLKLLKEFKEIHILSPAEFLKELEK